MNFRRSRRTIPELELTPLIDVIFQLLIFFLITTTFVSAPGMSIQRPQARNSGALQQKRLTIELPKDTDDEVFFEGKRHPVSALRGLLQDAYKKDPSAQVAIDADALVQHRRVVQVMDVATGVGFTNIGIVTSPNDAAGAPRQAPVRPAPRGP